MYYIAKRTVKALVDSLCAMLYNLYIFFTMLTIHSYNN